MAIFGRMSGCAERFRKARWWVAVVVVLAGFSAGAIRADDWPNWRGPARTGVSNEKGWLDRWPAEGPRVMWKAQAGAGFSSVAVAGGRVVTIGYADEKDTVTCLDAASGKQVWAHSYPAELGDKYFEGGTTGSPAIDGGKVYTLSRWGDVFCFEVASGKVVWNRNIQKELGVRLPTWGFAGSPTVHQDLVLLNAGEAGLALNKITGEKVWQSADKEAGYSTPLPWGYQGEELLLLGSGEAYLAVDLKTGKERWRYRWVTQYGVNAADPVPNGDKVFISSGYGKGAALLKIAGAGEPEVIWKSKVLLTQMNPPVLIGNFLYGIDGDSGDKPVLKCIEYTTGMEKWGESSSGCRSLIAADGKLIVLTERGELLVGAADPESFKPTSRAQVQGGKCWTAPVLANGAIFVRNWQGSLVCLDVRGAAKESGAH